MLDTACYKSVNNRPNSFKNVNIKYVVFFLLNFPFNSDLNQDIFDVHYFGRSGATTKTLLSSRHIQDCIECKPVRVFLQIGGNDIRKHTTYVDVFKRIRFVVAFHWKV
jgi:hypothetical protein